MTTQGTVAAKYEELVTAIAMVVPHLSGRRRVGQNSVSRAIKQLIDSGADVDKMTLREIAKTIGMPKQYPANISWHLNVAKRPIRLSRKILLEDVLIALGKTQDRENNLYAVSQEGMILHASGMGIFCRVDCWWNLGHDLAWHRDNAPKTIDFLHTLLCSTPEKTTAATNEELLSSYTPLP